MVRGAVSASVPLRGRGLVDQGGDLVVELDGPSTKLVDGRVVGERPGQRRRNSGLLPGKGVKLGPDGLGQVVQAAQPVFDGDDDAVWVVAGEVGALKRNSERGHRRGPCRHHGYWPWPRRRPGRLCRRPSPPGLALPPGRGASALPRHAAGRGGRRRVGPLDVALAVDRDHGPSPSWAWRAGRATATWSSSRCSEASFAARRVVSRARRSRSRCQARSKRSRRASSLDTSACSMSLGSPAAKAFTSA